jgi:hypothetical protein
LLSILKPSTGFRPEELELELTIDGDRRQHGATSQMLHDLPSLIRHLGERYGLLGGELIYRNAGGSRAPEVRQSPERFAQSGQPALQLRT